MTCSNLNASNLNTTVQINFEGLLLNISKLSKLTLQTNKTQTHTHIHNLEARKCKIRRLKQITSALSLPMIILCSTNIQRQM